MVQLPEPPSPHVRKINFAPGDYDAKKHIQETELISSRLRKVRFALRSLDFLCSVLVIGAISRALFLYFRSDVDIWPPSVEISAQLFFLVVAVTSFIFNSYILLTYIIRYKGMRKVISRLELGFQLAMTAIFLGVFTYGVTALSLIKSGRIGNGHNIFKIACERARAPNVPAAYWGICWTNEWAQVCGCIGAALSAASLALYVLIVVRFYQRRRSAIIELQAAEARALSLEHYNARGLQNPQLISEMTKMSLPPTV